MILLFNAHQFTPSLCPDLPLRSPLTLSIRHLNQMSHRSSLGYTRRAVVDWVGKVFTAGALVDLFTWLCVNNCLRVDSRNTDPDHLSICSPHFYLIFDALVSFLCVLQGFWSGSAKVSLQLPTSLSSLTEKWQGNGTLAASSHLGHCKYLLLHPQ